MDMLVCPLCHHSAQWFMQDKKRSYFSCKQCEFIFADPKSHIPSKVNTTTTSEQKQLVSFLLSGINNIELQNAAPLNILNFGQTIEQQHMSKLNRSRHNLKQFNPLYPAHSNELTQQYDLIACHQILSKLSQPAKEWQLLQRLLKPNALLVIEVPILSNIEQFHCWPNKKALQHIAFYHANTFQFIAHHFNLELVYQQKNLVLLRKQS
ncbi:MAG: methyltransferase domain-containing protein [Parashewanella sp.]